MAMRKTTIAPVPGLPMLGVPGMPQPPRGIVPPIARRRFLPPVQQPQSRTPFTREQIAHQARTIWEREGRPDGRELEHWFQAERELSVQREHSDKTQALVARLGGAPRQRR